MKIKFLGASGTVTGSSYILTSGSGKSILIDLGMFQGPDIDRLNYEPYDFDFSKLDGAVLTHAHLDHCGRLPILLPSGFTAPIFMTSATADLTALALLDSAKIAREDQKPFLYDKHQAIRTIEVFKRVYYRTQFAVGDFMVTLRDAGHIMGSSILEITDTQADSDIRKIVFSGDLGNSPDDLLHETELIDSADAVVMESTYGDRLHPADDPVDAVQAEINAVEKTGSTLLIPAFSLQRTQELLHIIMHLKVRGKIHGTTPVFMDSPMGEKATQIYGGYPEDFNDHIRTDMKTAGPFVFPGLVNVAHGSGSQAIHGVDGAKVIIAGSGMMTGGRILSHAVHYLPKSGTRLLIVGFQGEGTLGRELMEGAKSVNIDNMQVTVSAKVNNIQSMSSHADQGQLMKWLSAIKNVKKVFLTHGDDVPREALAKKITDDLGITDVTRPSLHKEVTI